MKSDNLFSADVTVKCLKEKVLIILINKFLSVTADHLHSPWGSEMFWVLIFLCFGSA